VSELSLVKRWRLLFGFD